MVRIGESMTKHILVIEDDLSILRLEQKILQAEGYGVETAVDGIAALAKLEATPYDAIVLDITLPGLDGYEVARRLRQFECQRDTPIVMVTGSGEPAARQWGFDAGAVVFFGKPFTAAAFRSVIRSVTGSA
jgi:CheY-like chemotaxis protein